MKTQLTERNVRATARKAGLKLEKARCGVADGYGPEKAYCLTDPDINLVVFGADAHSYGRSLQECATYLQLSPTERWYRMQEAVELVEQSRCAH